MIVVAFRPPQQMSNKQQNQNENADTVVQSGRSQHGPNNREQFYQFTLVAGHEDLQARFIIRVRKVELFFSLRRDADTRDRQIGRPALHFIQQFGYRINAHQLISQIEFASDRFPEIDAKPLIGLILVDDKGAMRWVTMRTGSSGGGIEAEPISRFRKDVPLRDARLEEERRVALRARERDEKAEFGTFARLCDLMLLEALVASALGAANAFMRRLDLARDSNQGVWEVTGAFAPVEDGVVATDEPVCLGLTEGGIPASPAPPCEDAGDSSMRRSSLATVAPAVTGIIVTRNEDEWAARAHGIAQAEIDADFIEIALRCGLRSEDVADAGPQVILRHKPRNGPGQKRACDRACAQVEEDPDAPLPDMAGGRQQHEGGDAFGMRQGPG